MNESHKTAYITTPSGETVTFESLQQVLNHFGWEVKILHAQAKVRMSDEAPDKLCDRDIDHKIRAMGRLLAEEAVEAGALECETITYNPSPYDRVPYDTTTVEGRMYVLKKIKDEGEFERIHVNM